MVPKQSAEDGLIESRFLYQEALEKLKVADQEVSRRMKRHGGKACSFHRGLSVQVGKEAQYFRGRVVLAERAVFREIQCSVGAAYLACLTHFPGEMKETLRAAIRTQQSMARNAKLFSALCPSCGKVYSYCVCPPPSCRP